MDKHLVGLERAQEEFHQAFNTPMEDVEDDLGILKIDVDMMGIRMSSTEKDMAETQEDIQMLELSVDNSHFCLEKVEDPVDRCVSSAQSQTRLCITNTRAMGLEIQQVQREWRQGHEDLLKLSSTGDIINRMFVHLDDELERIIKLVSQKIETKFEEVVAAKAAKQTVLETRVELLEERLRDTVVLCEVFLRSSQ